MLCTDRMAPEETAFVEVFLCADAAAMALARGSLDDAGILYLLNDELPFTVAGGRARARMALPCSIKVCRADVKTARARLSLLLIR